MNMNDIQSLIKVINYDYSYILNILNKLPLCKGGQRGISQIIKEKSRVEISHYILNPPNPL